MLLGLLAKRDFRDFRDLCALLESRELRVTPHFLLRLQHHASLLLYHRRSFPMRACQCPDLSRLVTRRLVEREVERGEVARNKCKTKQNTNAISEIETGPFRSNQNPLYFLLFVCLIDHSNTIIIHLLMTGSLFLSKVQRVGFRNKYPPRTTTLAATATGGAPAGTESSSAFGK